MAINLQLLPVPDILSNTTYNELLTAVRDNFQARNTDYTSIVEGDPGYTMLEAMAYFGTLLFGQVNDAVKAVLITHSTGDNLDILAAGFNIERRTNETDEELRQRTIDTLETLVPGSPAWYKGYALEADENVRDAAVYRKPDPNDPTEDIAGSVVVYVQGEDEVVPDNTTLQAVKNYINAEGSSYTDDEVEEAATQRRFICDTVEVEPIETLPYVLCAIIQVLPGLNKATVLEEIQDAAQDFVDEQARIGNKIPLSSIYAILDTATVSEVTLEHPQADIEPGRDTVPVALPDQELEVQAYSDVSVWADFADETGAQWGLIENSSEWHIVFTEDITSDDNSILDDIKIARRFDIHSTDTNGDKDELITTLRVTTEKEEYTNSNSRDHYYFELTDTPVTSDFTDGEDYIITARNSVEIRAAGL